MKYRSDSVQLVHPAVFMCIHLIQHVFFQSVELCSPEECRIKIAGVDVTLNPSHSANQQGQGLGLGDGRGVLLRVVGRKN